MIARIATTTPPTAPTKAPMALSKPLMSFICYTSTPEIGLLATQPDRIRSSYHGTRSSTVPQFLFAYGPTEGPRRRAGTPAPSLSGVTSSPSAG